MSLHEMHLRFVGGVFLAGFCCRLWRVWWRSVCPELGLGLGFSVYFYRVGVYNFFGVLFVFNLVWFVCFVSFFAVCLGCLFAWLV